MSNYMSMTSKKIIEPIETAEFEIIGTKASNLKRILENTNLLVPQTLVLTTDFYWEIARLNNLSLDNPVNWDRLIISEEYSNIILSFINENFGNSPLVIRSSATCEDTPLLSFAGQYSTFLNIRGAESILKAIKMCICSLYSANSLIYAERSAVNLDVQAIAVLIQKLVPVEMAGVIFTSNPVNPDDTSLLLEYTKGLGDKVVSGERKPTTETLKRGVLSPNKIINKVSAAAICIEELFGNPRDIEWGVRGDDVYIFQSRPITTGQMREARSPILTGKIIIKGTPASHGYAKGRLLIIDEEKDLDNIENGDIIYLREYNGMDFISRLRDISGLVTNGGVLSHLSVIAREFAIPSVCNLKGDITNRYLGRRVVINGYNGEISV